VRQDEAAVTSRAFTSRVVPLSRHAKRRARDSKATAKRARAEASLSAALDAVARLDTLLEHAPVGFAVVDTDYRFVQVNRPMADITGLPVDEHLGRAVSEVVPQLWEAVRADWKRVLDTGTPGVDREISGLTVAKPGHERHFLASYTRLASPDGDPLGLGAVLVDITERKRAEQTATVLAGASELFTSTLDLDTMLDQAVRLAIPEFADSCHLYLLTPTGSGRRVAMADVDRSLEPLLLDADSRYPLDVGGNLPTARALRERRSQLIERVTDAMRVSIARDEEHLRVLRRHGVSSAITTPLIARDQALGVLVLMYTGASGRRYRRDDVPLAEELARRFSQAIEGARLAREAERARSRLDLLARVGEVVTVDLDSSARLQRLTEVFVPGFADLSAVHVARADGALLLAHLATADGRLPQRLERVEDWPPLPPDGPAPASKALRTGEPVLLTEVPELLIDSIRTGKERDAGRSLGFTSMLCVPLVRPAGVFGTLTFAYTDSGRRYSPADVPLAEEIARRVGSVLEATRRFEQEQATAEVLQRSLMPERLPQLPDVDLAARYLPGTEELKVGGDWYDVLALPDHRVVLAIGDVVGHGVRAASAMGRIRSALELCALDGMSTGAALTRLNRYSWARDDAEMATLLLVAYDPRTARMTMASAGHPPPLVQRPGRAPEYLDGGGGAPLGAIAEPLYPETEADLPAGSRLLLYTDGLVERRGEPLDDGLRRLANAVRRGPEKLDELADQILAELLGDRGPEDDVALLVVRALASADTLALRCAARPSALGSMRDRLRDWLAAVGAGPTESEELILAVNEAAANAIEHAYGLEDAVFTVEGRLLDNAIIMSVCDEGIWRDRPTSPDRGRGLAIMRSFADEVEVDHDESGTKIELRRRLRREPEE